MCVFMKKWVSTIEKRNFLKWFLQNNRLKQTDAKNLINFLMNTHHILEKVTFTEKLSLNTRTIVISSLNSDEPGFEFYYNKRKTSDVATAIWELTSNPGKVHIILNFYGKLLNHRYTMLIESQIIENIKTYENYQRISKEVDELLETVIIEKKIDEIRHQIDHALDKKNEELFHSLVKQLNDLQKLKKSS